MESSKQSTAECLHEDAFFNPSFFHGGTKQLLATGWIESVPGIVLKKVAEGLKSCASTINLELSESIAFQCWFAEERRGLIDAVFEQGQ